jgi:hypothetical protein
VQQASQVSAIPSAQQHKFTYRLYASDYDQANDSPMLVFTEKTSRLVGKRLTLTYVPASQADADLIASYLPKPHADGSPIQPNELPASLPGYLIKLKPIISLDGAAVAQSSAALLMGTDLFSTGGFTQLYDPNQWDLTNEESNVAGNATAIGISAGGVSPIQLEQLKFSMTETRTRLQSVASTGSLSVLDGVTGEKIVGELLTAAIWSWFASARNGHLLGQNSAGILENPGLSYGLFHAVAQPNYSWGVIRKVGFPGVNMDIGHVRNLTWAKDGREQSWISYNRLRGQYMSVLEHAIPEQFFSDPAQCNLNGTRTANPALPPCNQGVSAMRAIELAAQSGQKVFSITRAVYIDNPNIVTARLGAHSESTKNRVQQALDVGYEVTIHEAPIAQSGWVGAGFILSDPATGAGGYLIDGGSNGGWYSLLVNAAGALIAITLFSGKLALAGLIAPFGIALGYLILAIAVVGVIAFILAELNGGYDRSCGGISTCESAEYIAKIVGLTVALALVTAGLRETS